MASIFPLFESIDFDTTSYSMEDQARMITSQPDWKDYIPLLVKDPLDTAIFTDLGDTVNMLNNEEDWFEAGRLLINFSNYFLRDLDGSYNDSYDPEERQSIIQNIANKVCNKHIELYKQLVVATNSYREYKTQKIKAKRDM